MNLCFCIVGPPECSLTVHANGATDSRIIVNWMWTDCLGVEPTNISLEWVTAHNSGQAIGISGVHAEITGLEPNTSYNITASFHDACGSIAAWTVAGTMPSTSKYNTCVLNN